jgi:hypothetical protein
VSGLPTGATGTFSPTSTTSGSTLSVATSASTPAGSYPLTISGTSGALTRTTSVTLVVQVLPDFTLGVGPSSRSVARGGTTSYTVTIGRVGGFTDAVTLSVTGLPGNTTATFAPNPATSSSTLTLTVLSKLQVGPRTITITGTSGSLNHSVEVTLVLG